MLYAAAIYGSLVSLILILLVGAYWRQRRDVWIHTHSAPFFAIGERIEMQGRLNEYGRVVRVTRYALLVRPCK